MTVSKLRLAGIRLGSASSCYAPLGPAARSAGLGMDASERLDQIRHQRGKAGIERWPAGDQNIVEVASRVVTHNVADRSLEAPLDAIALDRIADLLADGEAKPGSAG